MKAAEWEILNEMLGIIAEIAQTSTVYSATLAKRIRDLDNKLAELPTEDE